MQIVIENASEYVTRACSGTHASSILGRRPFPVDDLRYHFDGRSTSLRRRLAEQRCAPSQLPADGGAFCAAEDRFGLVQQLPGVFMQRAILPGQFVARIFHQFRTALVKILALFFQVLTCLDQVVRDFFSFAD
jgi:hypothetical protein